MDRPYIEKLRIQDYGCIRDATLTLTPLHALVGPNDSGKSTILRALQTVALAANRSPPPAPVVIKRALVDDHSAAGGTPGGSTFEVSTGIATWRVAFDKSGDFFRGVSFPHGESPDFGPADEHWHRLGFPGARELPISKDISTALLGTQLLRLDPDALRTAHPLIPDGQPLRFVDDHGTGLPAIYDGVMVRDLDSFTGINKDFRHLFPQVKSIYLANPSSNTKAIGVKLNDGVVVPAELMSEGMLYYLAFAALPYLDPTAFLLIEEPENGLHPARIADVMHVLRAVSKRTQLLIATHSPLVVNELKPDEVTVVTRTSAAGTKVKRIVDTPNFEERSKVYALGELWLSYANGTDEAPLLEGGPPP